MDISQFLIWLHDTPFATTIRENSFLFPWIESVHVLALTLVVGSISIVDLRLLGIASVNRSIASLTGEVLPFTWTAFLIALLTGSALFSSHAVGYAQNLQFRMKMLLLALAGINMLVFHLVLMRGTERWSESGATPGRGKVAGLISLLLWIGIVAFGRWIGFATIP
jgi:hypothetical protein